MGFSVTLTRAGGSFRTFAGLRARDKLAAARRQAGEVYASAWRVRSPRKPPGAARRATRRRGEGYNN